MTHRTDKEIMMEFKDSYARYWDGDEQLYNEFVDWLRNALNEAAQSGATIADPSAIVGIPSLVRKALLSEMREKFFVVDQDGLLCPVDSPELFDFMSRWLLSLLDDLSKTETLRARLALTRLGLAEQKLLEFDQVWEKDKYVFSPWHK